MTVINANGYQWKMIYCLHLHCCLQNDKVRTGHDLGEEQSPRNQTCGQRAALVTKEIQ